MEKDFFSRREFEEAASYILERTRYKPKIGLVLGSGMGGLVREVEEPDIIPYEGIPHFPVPTVEGHPGELFIGMMEGEAVMVMRGRTHYYEGYSMGQIAIPIRAMQLLGIKILIVTNAAGGLNPNFEVGDLMLITDHINLIGMAGFSPLRGPNDPLLGPRFPDMSKAYDLELRELALRVAESLGISLREGVYICLAGPSYETPAEIRFLRKIGADAVGMSTVPEVIVARHAGMRVLGISGISNIAIAEPEEERKTTHEEVLEAGKVIVPKLTALLKGVIRELGRK
jgi:purine-nucleoside phosphorylase